MSQQPCVAPTPNSSPARIGEFARGPLHACADSAERVPWSRPSLPLHTTPHSLFRAQQTASRYLYSSRNDGPSVSCRGESLGNPTPRDCLPLRPPLTKLVFLPLSVLLPWCPCDPSYPVLGAYRRFVAIVKRSRAPRCLRPSFWPPTLVLPPSSVCVCALSRIASLNKFPLGRSWKLGLFLSSSQCLLRSQSGASTEVTCRMSKPEQQVWLPFRAHVGWF